MKTFTIRGVEPEVSEKLRSKANQEGKSINQLILEIIKAGLGLKKVKQYSRELMTWMTCLAVGPKKNTRKLKLKSISLGGLMRDGGNEKG